MGAGGGYRDYIDAEYAVMGIDGLLIALGLAERHRRSLDELNRLVQNAEAHEPEKLATALQALQKELAGGTQSDMNAHACAADDRVLMS